MISHEHLPTCHSTPGTRDALHDQERADDLRERGRRRKRDLCNMHHNNPLHPLPCNSFRTSSLSHSPSLSVSALSAEQKMPLAGAGSATCRLEFQPGGKTVRPPFRGRSSLSASRSVCTSTFSPLLQRYEHRGSAGSFHAGGTQATEEGTSGLGTGSGSSESDMTTTAAEGTEAGAASLRNCGAAANSACAPPTLDRRQERSPPKLRRGTRRVAST